ncbi:dTDP-4-dehydrorhamnose reductase [Natrarchaeobius chitinivorans]|uniref:dTDP-4-dehydrorhamnose reductase n=1 Tax=Natrarchaeobius chitinivorans TaxID=1679083 RepID=A0A3N6MGS5_NATCH|nr:dTDP-4-dehydrorhamnose reductase [Natrarchaeobius chitinivorans]RQG96040.1 dTDP-4-dehydrorhamnose reductase [Natrarchaeobius chitinivorans]
MDVLVLGAGGLLGSALVRRCLDRSIATVGTYHSTAPDFEIQLEHHNIRDTAAFRSLLDTYQPDTVVNCAALTDVDGCETSEATAAAINGTAPGELAGVCAARDIQFVHISTDYVFDGTATEPYTESEPTNPIQVYGESKLQGEQNVQETDAASLILRLSFVYGVRGDTTELVGFPAWVRETLRAGDDVPLFVDQQFTPTRAGQAAATILDFLETEATGIYHVASRSCVTPHEFGHKIARLQGANADLIQESERSDVSRDAPRPAYTCLDVRAVEDELGRRQPTLEDDLRAIETQFDVSE